MSVFNMAASPSTSLDEDILLNGTFFAAKKLNINGFKDLQLQAILSVLRGKDTFVSLPTGYGKSAIFQAIPLCKDHLRAHAQESGYAAAVELRNTDTGPADSAAANGEAMGPCKM